VRKLIILACLTVAGLLLVSCVDVDADASRFSLADNQSTAAPPPNPNSDPRTAGDLRCENDQLRQRLTELENDQADLQRAIDRQKSLNDDLEHQKDRLEDDRDRYKDALDD